jgi:hypothetical protein
MNIRNSESCRGGNTPTVSTCDFQITESGTTVYDQRGGRIMEYETEDAAVEAIRELEKMDLEGGVDGEI